MHTPDPYRLLCERARADILALGKFDLGVLHTTPVAALLVTAEGERAGNQRAFGTYAVDKTKPELMASLLHAGLQMLEREAPAVHAELMRRLATEMAAAHVVGLPALSH